MVMSQGAVVGSLVSMGASFVMQGIGDALKNNQGGLSVAVTSPVGSWSYVYGTQKVGGVKIFSQSNNNTGGSGSTSNNKQLHEVYCLACHPCVVDTDGAPWQLRVGGKQVLVNANGPGWSSYSPTQITQNITSISRSSGVVTMVLVGGIANQDGLNLSVTGVNDNTYNGTWVVTQPNPSDDTTFTYICGGPDSSSTGGAAETTFADYQDKIYVEFLSGNHTATFPTLLAAGTSWQASDLCLGRTLAYVQLGWASNVFPSGIPDISFVIQGKNNIYDPRTSSYGYTDNAALCVADFLTIPATQGGFGLTMGTNIPTAALSAAAAVCDEAVDLAGGGTEQRYTCNTFFMLNQARGSILQSMLTSCAGRISYQGGQYSIFPGAWVAPTLSLTDADLVGGIEWHPRFGIRDTCNAVKGVYVSPENNYEQGDIPYYAEDALHGYVSDQWLAEDNGERIFKEATFLCTDSSATAQRLAKIALLRTRFQGRGTIRCSLKAYQCVALDVVQLTHPRYTWVNKPFEVLSSRFVPDKSGTLTVELDIAETDSSIYDWSITEQLTPQGWAQPQSVGTLVADPPNDVSCYSGPGETVDGIVYPSTINTTASGIAYNSIYVRWDEIYDTNIVEGGHVEVQWQPNGASYWNALTNIAPTATSIFIPGVTDGAEYNVQVRTVNFANVPSAWVFSGPVTVSNSLSSLAYSGIPVATTGTLTAQAFSGGTAAITVLPFTASVGSISVSCTPTPSVITSIGSPPVSLAQSQLYYVYYIDPSFLGGSIFPIATQNPSDFENKIGYFLINSIVTPSYSPRYSPSSFTDLGSASTSSPTAAYDNNIMTDAIVNAQWMQWNWTGLPGSPTPPGDFTTVGDCKWQGFPAVTTGATTNLNFVSNTVDSSGGVSWDGSVFVKAGGTTLGTLTPGSTESDGTVSIPSGTDLSTVTVEAVVQFTSTPPTPGTVGASATGTVQMLVYEIYIQ
jgi:hypothetical protein